MWSNIDNELHVKYSFFLSDFNETWIFSEHFRKKKSYTDVQKSRIAPYIYLFIYNVFGFCSVSELSG